MKHVLIIGAGLNGLVIADKLTSSQISVTILEGRDRIGGRTLSTSSSGLDLGGTWTWPHDKHLRSLAKELELDLFSQHWSGESVSEDRSRRRHLIADMDMDNSKRIVAGAQSLSKALLRRIENTSLGELHLGKVAVQVDYSQPDRVKVTCEDGKVFEADRVVVAIPPQLAMHKMTFQPPLSNEKYRALDSIPTWMGNSMKVVLEFTEAFWRKNGLSGFAWSEAGPVFQFFDACGQQGKPAALFGFMNPGSYQLSRDEESGLRQRVLRQVWNLFGEGELVDFHAKDWSSDEMTNSITHDQNTRPSHGHPRPTALAREPLTSQLPPTSNSLRTFSVWFGSTETAKHHAGFLEGAVERGIEIAREIIESLEQS